MSDPVTALGGAQFTDGIAEIHEVPLQGMITLRGDLGDPAVQKAATHVSPGEMPQAGQARMDGDTGVAWMSPDEALILCAYTDVAGVMAQMQKTLGPAHALVVDVSDARASFRITGAHVRDVIAKLAPVDMSPDAFAPGQFRRTRLAQVPAALWMPEDTTCQIICFRSHARYAFDVLTVAAAAGSEVHPSERV